MELFGNNGALFSPCRRYRYMLWRIWDDSKPLVMFIGLNPSKANESKPDNTITRVISMANSWGYGGVYMMNLFSYVSTKPEELVHDDDKEANYNRLKEIASKCDRVIFAWGQFDVKGRDKEVIAMFPNAYALIINKDGSPRHPLYVRGDVEPVPYQP